MPAYRRVAPLRWPRCLVAQGGGLYICCGATVRMSTSQVYSNTAGNGPNVYIVSSGSLCTFGMSLTGVYNYEGTVSTCDAPPPDLFK